MLKLALVDEENCFSKIEAVKKQYGHVLQIDTILAKSPCDFDEYVAKLKDYEVIGLHRQIWIDECDRGDKCFESFQEALGDKVYGIGKPGDSHQACSEGLAAFAVMAALSVINQKDILREGDKVNLVINNKVLREEHVATNLTMIGGRIPAFTLKDKLNQNEQKYFRYADLVKV